MRQGVEVLVVGGGPAGAATAVALAARGREVLILDRAVFPRDKLCGDFIHPFGVAALDELGMLDTVRHHARILHGMMIVSPAGRAVRVPFPSGVGLSLRRAVLDHLLLSEATRVGAGVETGRAVRGAYRRHGRWRVITDGGEVAARVLVGADGLHSVVGRAAGLGRRSPLKRGRYAIGLQVRGLQTREGFAEMHLARAAYCGVSGFLDGEANVTTVQAKAVLSRHRDLIAHGPADKAAHHLLAPFPALRGRLEPARITGIRAVGPLAPAAQPVVGEGVLLVGDAASFTDPLTGQGVSMALTGAIRAAGVLDRTLKAGDVTAAALAPYACWLRERSGALRRFLKMVDWLALRSPLIEPLARAWQRHPLLAAQFLGVIGNGEPVRRVLSPAYVSRLALACIWRA